MTDKNVKTFLIPILIIVLAYSIFQTIESDKSERQLREENNYTIGVITNHRITGMAETYNISFTYSVNEQEYIKTVSHRWHYSDCENTRNCIGLKHVVYYDIENPKNAFMDFDITQRDMNKLEMFRNEFNELKHSK